MLEELTYYCDSKRHLVCVPYSVENLHRMAEDLNINRSWFHFKSCGKHHYDIPKKRIAEITQKCVMIDQKSIVKIIRNS